MNRPVTTAVLALAMLLSACGDGDDDETRPDPVDIEFGAPSSNRPLDVPPDCSMVPGVVVARDGAQPAPRFNPFAITTPEEAEEVGLDITEDELGILQPRFQLFAVSESPLDVTTEDPERDGDVSPVYVYGVGGHVVFVPASGARPEIGGPTALPYADGAEGVLGVVDTGLNPDMQLDEVRVVDTSTNLDDDVPNPNSPVAGHGTFIASLVRQLPAAPGVVMTRARLAEHSVTDGTTASGQLVSDTAAGWSVYHATIRLADELAGSDAPLSLSLVTRICGEELPGKAILLEEAIAYWDATVGGDVFAGAGNSTHAGEPARPALAPGSFPTVTAVAADGWNGRRAVFSNQGETSAPGVCMVADRGPNFGGVAAWSGTSFATPLAAASSIGAQATYADLGQQDGRRLDPEVTRPACALEEESPPSSTTSTSSSTSTSSP